MMPLYHRVLILQPSLTDAVLWEIERSFATVARSRILLSVLNYEGRPGAYERLWLLLQERHHVRLPRSVPFEERSCFVDFDAERNAYRQPVVHQSVCWWPLFGNAVDIAATLGPYLSALDGGAPKPPTHVTRPEGLELAGSLVLSLSFPILILLATRAIARSLLH